MEIIPPPSINPDKKEILNNTEEIQIQENIKFLISYSESLIFFQVIDSNEFPPKKYELSIGLEKLYKIDNYFKMFNNLNQIQNIIINEYKNKRIIFKKNENNVKMTITNVILNNNFDINIPLIKQAIDINIIVPIIKELKQKIEMLEKEKIEMK